ncbi:unnamed protein product [Symbiodinium natans]|uniref:Uncharacterized protein n=1 Tax=Symbiodinium natans TaxID=878477 RepID=A0A812HEE1_9DINO|nr:unnamed protein product [Symbiodinium natans]
MAIALNLDGFWIRKVDSHVSWEPCLVCRSCLPGYVRSRLPLQSSCELCTHQSMIVNIAIFLFLVVARSQPESDRSVVSLFSVRFSHVVLALWLAKLGVERRSNPKDLDLRLGYLKLLLLYLIVEAAAKIRMPLRVGAPVPLLIPPPLFFLSEGALAETAIEILNDFRTSDLGPILGHVLAVFTWSPHLALRGRALFDGPAGPVCTSAAPAGAGYLHGEGVAVSNSIAGSAASEAVALLPLDVLADSLSKLGSKTTAAVRKLNHTAWFSEDAAPVRESLPPGRRSLLQKDYQYSTELYAQTFWLFLYVSNFVYVWACSLTRTDGGAGVVFGILTGLIWDSSFNSRAIFFYQETLASYDAEDWLAFIQAYFQKWGVFGLWSWDLAAARAEGFGSWARVFTEQSYPLLISLILVLYGSVLAGLLEFARCSEVPHETVRRSLFAPEVQCLDFSTHLARLCAILAVLWLLGVPLVLGWVLNRARNHLSEDFEFPVEVSVLSFGYRLGCWRWESYIFLLKGFVIGSSLLSPMNRSSFLFLVAVLHGFISRSFNPFTSRSDFALVKADGRFALFFVAHSILIQFLAVSTSIPRNLRILGVVLISCMVLLNVLLLVYLLVACFACWQDTFIESYEFYDWELWRKKRRCLTSCVRMPVTMLLDHYKRRVRRRAYVSFDPSFGWLTVCGSHGDQAKATVNWRSGRPPDLSAAPAVPNGEVAQSTAGQRRKVQKYLHQAAERLSLIKGCATFSVLELEFIIRAAFVFARRAELQKSRLARPLTLISQEESFLGLDALELLWSSLDLEAVGAWNNCEGYEGHVFMMVHVRLLCEYGAL